MSPNKLKPSFLNFCLLSIFIFGATFILSGFILNYSNSLKFFAPEAFAQASLGCHTYGDFPNPTIEGSPSGSGRQVIITWTWPATKTVADIAQCAGSACWWLVLNLTPLVKPVAGTCPGTVGCPRYIGGVEQSPPYIGAYSCDGLGATTTCTYTYTTNDMPHCCSCTLDLSKIPVEVPSACCNSVCYDIMHYRLKYFPCGFPPTPDCYSKCSDYGPCPGVTCNNPPNTPTLIAPPDGSAVIGNWINSNPTFTATVSDPDLDNVRAYFHFSQITDNPSPPSDQNGNTVASGNNSTWTPSPALADGKYDWQAKAIDSSSAESGWTGYWRVKKDTLTPDAPTCSVSAVGTSITVTRSATDPIPSPAGTPSGIATTTLERRINGGLWSIVSQPAGTDQGEQYSADWSGDYTETGTAGDTYEYQLTATDGAGNNSPAVNCGSVTLNNPPTAVNLLVDPPNSADYCTDITGYPPVRVRWQFSDPDSGDTQSLYRIQVFKQTDGSLAVDTLEKSDNCSGDCDNYAFQVAGEQLSWDTPYNWRLMVWDNHNTSSTDWIYPISPGLPTPAPGISFTTPVHSYPQPAFTHSPAMPRVGDIVTFIDSSTCYDANNSATYTCSGVNPNTGSYNHYEWDLGNGTICDSTSDPLCLGTVTSTYAATGNYTVRLSITDDLGTCDPTGTVSITTSLPLPEYREVAPVGWLDNFLARLISIFR